MKRPPKPAGDVDDRDVEQTLERLREGRIEAKDYAAIEHLLRHLLWLLRIVRAGRTTIEQMRRLLGWTSSEKTRDVLGRATTVSNEDDPPPDPDGPNDGTPAPSGEPSGGAASSPEQLPAAKAKRKRKGHGRLKVDEYAAAEHSEVAHESLRPGDRCPLCGRGSLYALKDPQRVLRVVGQPPLRALCWDCQRLRCSACGAVHSARAPDEGQGGKYAQSAASMLAVLRFGTGVPHHRLEHLQENLETPIPASTQWEVLYRAAEDLRPVHGELIRQAAQGRVLHNDDTRGPLLSQMGRRREALLAQGALEDPERAGLFTTAIVAQTNDDHRIALFFTGRKHAGENLATLLGHRAEGLGPPIQMSDALTANNPAGASVISSHCWAHARRNFVDEIGNFPEECRYLLEQIGAIFAVEKDCRLRGLSGEERLREHQLRSAPVLERLRSWMTAQLEQRLVEPNSGLGKAFQYLLKRWDAFTRFLRLTDVPLENNICERALKMAIRHRKNSLFYRTERGAETGDLFMSLIHTTQLCGENAFDYITALLTRARHVAQAPAEWMPWNWREAANARRQAA